MSIWTPDETGFAEDWDDDRMVATSYRYEDADTGEPVGPRKTIDELAKALRGKL